VSDLRQRLQEVEYLQKADLAYVESFEAGAKATMEHLQVLQDVDKISSYLQYITDSALKKGVHLPLQVKLLCQWVFSNLVYYGKCSTYLSDKATGIIHCKDAYCHAIEIAKFIYLSGSLLNLSRYNILWLGLEAYGTGRVEQMGGLLASKHQVKKAM
jgi:hypothetical protein